MPLTREELKIATEEIIEEFMGVMTVEQDGPKVIITGNDKKEGKMPILRKEFADKAYVDKKPEEHGGIKFDEDKLRMDLLPPKAITELAKVLTYGANKYEPNNWQGVKAERYTAALLRHIVAWMGGENYDEESSLHHLSHALCNIAFLVHKEV